MSQEQVLIQVIVNGIMLGMTLSLFVLGLNLVFGLMHIVNFAHGQFYMLGGYMLWVVFESGMIPLPGTPVVRFILGMIITMIIIGVIGVLFEKLFLKKFRGDLMPSLIISLGFISILQTGALKVFGLNEKTITSVFPGKIALSGMSLSMERLAVILIGIVLLVAVYLFNQKTFTGRAMKAVAQNYDAAALQGISIDKISAIGMALGCGLAAAAGVLNAPIFMVHPYIGDSPLLLGLAAIIIGGLGSIPGAVIGAMMIGFIQSFGSTYLDSQIATMIVYVLLVVTMIIKPRGLWGHGE